MQGMRVFSSIGECVATPAIFVHYMSTHTQLNLEGTVKFLRWRMECNVGREAAFKGLC